MEIRHRKWRFTISSWGLRWSEKGMKWNQLIVENGQLIFCESLSLTKRKLTKYEKHNEMQSFCIVDKI